MPATNTPYRGRFAPSPSGPLHLGSLVTALASYLDAKHNHGTWLVRIDDLDPPREQPGAAQGILHSLESHGLHWDEEITWQSHHSAAYEQALELLNLHRKTFNCSCTRQQLSATGACQNSCQTRQALLCEPWAIRIERPLGTEVEFTDQLQGLQSENLGQNTDNYVVKRKDGLYAYQLAVVVDDANASISHIVRGSDLLETTGRQIYLQQTLTLPTPRYCHLPVITNELAQKYSKQNHAPALIDADAAQNLRQALAFLKQSTPPPDCCEPESILAFASLQWSLSRVPPVMAVPASSITGPV
ncbi:MAG: tRNA glutamyl-Q(34) synthetase GluQRS [Halioglobus sp.]